VCAEPDRNVLQSAFAVSGGWFKAWNVALDREDVMQSLDENNRIVQSVPVDLGNMNDLKAKTKSGADKGGVAHVIAKLPKAGDAIDIHGLKYTVEFADYVRGKFTVKLTIAGE
jgi:Mg2+/Co2+ transporter CorC